MTGRAMPRHDLAMPCQDPYLYPAMPCQDHTCTRPCHAMPCQAMTSTMPGLDQYNARPGPVPRQGKAGPVPRQGKARTSTRTRPVPVQGQYPDQYQDQDQVPIPGTSTQYPPLPGTTCQYPYPPPRYMPLDGTMLLHGAVTGFDLSGNVVKNRAALRHARVHIRASLTCLSRWQSPSQGWAPCLKGCHGLTGTIPAGVRGVSKADMASPAR